MWGWEPREFVDFHYSDDGALIGQTVTREPEFSADDLSLLLAHSRAVTDRGSHGQPMSEAMDPRANPSSPGGWHYEVVSENPSIDYAQLPISQAQDAYFEKYKDKLSDAQRQSMHWRVRRVDG